MRKSNLSTFEHLLTFKSKDTHHKTSRATQIVATIGKDMRKEELQEMIAAGMNIARMDMSDKEIDKSTHEGNIEKLRDALITYNMERGKTLKEGHKPRDVHVAIGFDLKGSRIVTGKIESNVSVTLEKDCSINLTNHKNYVEHCSDKWIYIPYQKLVDVNMRQYIIIGKDILLEAQELTKETENSVEISALKCKIIKGGPLESEMSVAMPKARLELQALTSDDLEDIAFAREQKVDILFVPVRSASAFGVLKCQINPAGQDHRFLIIAKIEAEQAVEEIDLILKEADGIVVARSVLGIDISPEYVVVVQKQLIARALKSGKPSMVSYEMMSAMGKSGLPTHAELADVVNAVIDGADGTILTDETKGEYPSACVEAMSKSIMEAEDMINFPHVMRNLISHVDILCDPTRKENEHDHALAIGAAQASIVIGANCIVCLTKTGRTARLISKYRPQCPIIAIAPSPYIARQCLIYRGVFPVSVPCELKRKFSKIAQYFVKQIIFPNL